MKKFIPPVIAALFIGVGVAFLSGATGPQPAGDSVSVTFDPSTTLHVVGVDGGTPMNVNVTNSISVSNTSVGNVDAGAPTAATLVAGKDQGGINTTPLRLDNINNGLSVSPIASTYVVGTITKTAVSTTTAAHTGMAANSCLRVMCDIDIFYLTGTGTPTATTSTVPLPAKTVEKFCMTGAATAIAYITASGTGNCYDGIIPQNP